MQLNVIDELELLELVSKWFADHNIGEFDFCIYKKSGAQARYAEEQVADLEDKVDELEDRVSELECDVDNLEDYNRELENTNEDLRHQLEER